MKYVGLAVMQNLEKFSSGYHSKSGCRDIISLPTLSLECACICGITESTKRLFNPHKRAMNWSHPFSSSTMNSL